MLITLPKTIHNISLDKNYDQNQFSNLILFLPHYSIQEYFQDGLFGCASLLLYFLTISLSEIGFYIYSTFVTFFFSFKRFHILPLFHIFSLLLCISLCTNLTLFLRPLSSFGLLHEKIPIYYNGYSCCFGKSLSFCFYLSDCIFD